MVLLRFSFNGFDGEIGEAGMWFESAACSGFGTCWANPASLSEAADAFSTYPIDPANPPTMSLGDYPYFGATEFVPQIYISAAHLDGRGTIGLRVKVRSDRFRDDHSAEPDYQASALLHATYADLERLSQGLMALGLGRKNEFEMTLKP